MKSPGNLVFRIGPWRVDPALDEIYKGNETIKLEPRTMRLLVCLAEHAGAVVSVEQLLDQVWKDVVVTPNSVYTRRQHFGGFLVITQRTLLTSQTPWGAAIVS
jgi:transcriptional activator of cad operon